MRLTKIFNFKRAENPRWYIRILWLRLMYWPTPMKTLKPKRLPFFSFRFYKHTTGRRLHFDIGPIEGFLAKL